jgi:phage gpG-like protein
MSGSVQVHNVDGVLRRFHSIASKSQDMTPVWPKVGSYLSNEVRQQFATQGLHFGTPWKPLTPAYARRKRKMGGGKILVLSGDLRRSFVGRPMDIEVYSKDRARFGSSRPTAIWHQKGTHRNGKRVNPPRPMMRVTKKVRSDVRKKMADHIMSRL